MSYSKLPQGAPDKIKPFKIETPQEKIDELKTLIKLSKIAPKTFESLYADTKNDKYGINYEWLQEAKEEWLKFNWRKTEEHLNSFPHFMAPIMNRGSSFDIHFVALFSEREDAIPLVFLHGWPGDFLEFIPTLQLLQAEYTPAELPYHVIVPSLPGYAYSSGPPLDRDPDPMEMSEIIDSLMKQLGFGDGYIAQGGDIGSFVSRLLLENFPSCKAAHVNFFVLYSPPQDAPEVSSLPEHEQRGLAKTQNFYESGFAYGQAHKTRPATMGFVLQSSPIALLAWIGEKFISWSDETPSLQTILESITLYWFTETIARCIYPYRQVQPYKDSGAGDDRPLGFSSFAKELMPTPESWAKAKNPNIVFYRYHEKGGHFAALEKPNVLLQDVKEFVQQVWKN